MRTRTTRGGGQTLAGVTGPDPFKEVLKALVNGAGSILENVGKSSINFWKTTNSWGYGAISFVIRTANGTELKLAKRPRGWDSNVPGYFTLDPKQVCVYAVDLADGTWTESVESARIFAPGTIPRGATIQAVFSMSKETSVRQGTEVWDGAVQTPPYSLIMERDK